MLGSNYWRYCVVLCASCLLALLGTRYLIVSDRYQHDQRIVSCLEGKPWAVYNDGFASILHFEKPEDVTDATVERIMQLPRLRELFLSNTQVTDATLQRLQYKSTIEVLYLDGTHVTEDEVEGYCAAHPYVSVASKMYREGLPPRSDSGP